MDAELFVNRADMGFGGAEGWCRYAYVHNGTIRSSLVSCGIKLLRNESATPADSY